MFEIGKIYTLTKDEISALENFKKVAIVFIPYLLLYPAEGKTSDYKRFCLNNDFIVLEKNENYEDMYRVITTNQSEVGYIRIVFDLTKVFFTQCRYHLWIKT